MLVILKKEVPNLGEAGQIVKVRNGYGRNFLLPRGLAIPALESNVRVLEHQQRIADAIRRKELVSAKELDEQIRKMGLTFRRETGEDDKLFGSVTAKDIAEQLAAEGITLDRRAVLLDDAIRSIGAHAVKVRLHRDVTSELRVFVIKAKT